MQDQAIENSEGIVDTLEAWMRDISLPFWAARGLDPATGLFHEAMDAQGVPLANTPLRVRVQFRQIYALSHAAVLGWLPEGAAIAHAAWGKLRRAAAGDDPAQGFVHILTPDGTIADSRRDSYDHAFAVLAMSWLRRATGDSAVDRDLDAVLGFVDGAMTDPLGALTEGVPPALPRRQNPQMHWFEAMIALHEAAGRDEGLARAGRMLAFMQERMFDPASGTIGEFFDDRWQPAAGPAGEAVEPGHLAEWTWLLRRYETLAGLPRAPLASSLLDSALRSRDPATGLMVDACDRQARIRTGTRRSWLATELAKAWTAEVEAGRPGARAEAVAALTVLDHYHLRKPFAAGWIDRLDETAAPVPGPVPSSILYHVFVAVVEAGRVLGTSAASRQRA
jgi:mannose-6-phosphate isomerase